MKFTAGQLADYKAYERVRLGGRYNMIMDGARAMRAAKLDRDSYLFVMKNYDALRKAVQS